MATPPRHIRLHQVGDVTIVRFNNLERKVGHPETETEIGEELYSLVEPGRPSNVLLAFEDAPFIPFANFEGKLVSLYKRIKKEGGSLKMAGVHNSVMDVFRINGLAPLFSIYKSTEAAIADT